MGGCLNIGEILIWEAINVLLLIPPVMVLVMLTRWIRGRPVFTGRDWLFLLGYNREKALSLRLWLRFVKLWFVGLAIGYYLSPYGAGWLVGALIVAGAAALFIAPKWLR